MKIYWIFFAFFSIFITFATILLETHAYDALQHYSTTEGDGNNAQWATIEALLTALHATFPKATLIDVERWNRHTANIREVKESRWAKIFE